MKLHMTRWSAALARLHLDAGPRFERWSRPSIWARAPRAATPTFRRSAASRSSPIRMGRRSRPSRPKRARPVTRAKLSCASSPGTSSRPMTIRRRFGSTSGCSAGRRPPPWTWARRAMYQMFGRNGVVLGGMFNSSPQMPGPPGWLHYVLVDDVNRAVDAVKAGGGQVLMGPWKCRAATGSRSAGSARRHVRGARAEEVIEGSSLQLRGLSSGKIYRNTYRDSASRADSRSPIAVSPTATQPQYGASLPSQSIPGSPIGAPGGAVGMSIRVAGANGRSRNRLMSDASSAACADAPVLVGARPLSRCARCRSFWLAIARTCGMSAVDASVIRRSTTTR